MVKTIVHYPSSDTTKISLLLQELRDSGYEICLFGMGNYAKNRLAYLQEDCLEKVNFLCDNDSKKWNTELNGIKCISIAELENKKNSVVCVVFEQAYHIEIKKQLVKMGVAHLVSISTFSGSNNTKSAETSNIIKSVFLASYVQKINGKTFSKYRGINKGKEVVIVGTGPTLDEYVPVKNAVHIGVNTAIYFKKIKLKYYFVQDDYCRNYLNDIIKYPCEKFFAARDIKNAHYHIAQELQEILLNNGLKKYIISDIPNLDFVLDISVEPLSSFSSTIFAAAQFALWTMPKKIYLVGCDVTATGHYSKQTFNINTDSMMNAIYEDWLNFKKFTSINYPETEIISINPIRLRGVFSKDIYTKSFLEKYPDIQQ